MSAKAQRFVARNRTSPIIAGAWLTSNKQPIYAKADHDDATYLRYSFAGGGKVTLHLDDVTAIRAAGHSPIWAPL